MDTCQKVCEVIAEIARNLPKEPDKELWMMICAHMDECPECKKIAEQIVATLDNNFMADKIQIQATNLGTFLGSRSDDDDD